MTHLADIDALLESDFLGHYDDIVDVKMNSFY